MAQAASASEGWRKSTELETEASHGERLFQRYSLFSLRPLPLQCELKETEITIGNQLASFFSALPDERDY